MAEEKQAAEDVAAALKLANEKKIREELIAQLIQRWKGQNQNKEITEEQKQEFERQADAQIAAAHPNAQPAAPLSKSQEALKEQLSKFSDVFQGGRFEFIGTAIKALGDFFVKLMPVFQSIMPMLKNIGPMFNRAAEGSKELSDATPMDVVNNLLEKGRLTAANAMLKEEELQLLNDMDKALGADKESEVFKEHTEKLTACRQELKTLEDDLEALTPLKKDETKKDDLKAHLEKIERDLKTIKGHYDTLQPLVAAAGDSLKSVSLVFDRMKPIIEAHQKLCEREAAALPKTVTPPV